MGGLAGATPVYAAAFGFFMLASSACPACPGSSASSWSSRARSWPRPVDAAIAALVMILAAAYLLWMYQRVFTGELSDFLRGLATT